MTTKKLENFICTSQLSSINFPTLWPDSKSEPKGCFGLRIQPADATHWLNRSAGVSKFNVSLGLSLSLLATAFSLFW